MLRFSHRVVGKARYRREGDSLLGGVDSVEVVVGETGGSSVVFSVRKTDTGVEIASSDGRAFTAHLGFGETVEAPEGKVVISV